MTPTVNLNKAAGVWRPFECIRAGVGRDAYEGFELGSRERAQWKSVRLEVTYC